jgi:glycosyltransferase involved in cell wall biosynthesis
VSAGSYEQILVVGDHLPAAGTWGADRRVLQLLFDVRALVPGTRLVYAATEAAPDDHWHAWSVPAGVEVVAPPIEWPEWLAGERFNFSLVVLTGPASSRRLLEPLRSAQPQALVLGLLSPLAPLVAGDERRFDHPEERAGARCAAELRKARDDALLARLDGILCAGDGERARVAALAGAIPSFAYPPGVERDDHPPFARRTGIVSWGRFGAEPGDPDEAATLLGEAVLRPVLGVLAPGVELALHLEHAPSGLTAYDARPHELPNRLRKAAVLVVAREFGAPTEADALVAAAADAGTPVVALRGSVSDGSPAILAVDAADLARGAAALATDPATWDGATARLDAWSAARTRAHALDALGQALVAAGIAARPGASPLPLPPATAGTSTGPRTTQQQVQSLGFAERRPTVPAYARADIPQDQLWPHLHYAAWYEAHPLGATTKADLARQASTLPATPLVSIVMPVYNTDPEVLEAAVASVLDQTYPFWELCAVDDASTDEYTVAALADLATRDRRIKVDRLAENAGIVGASNAALAMAAGDFIALLDHDDVLVPEALFEVVNLLNEEPDLDFVYSDEDKLDPDDRRTTPFFKPSWSPHLHLGVNYVTHFAVYRRSLLDRLGGFRAGFDGSQDYDLSLRATEVARRVGHVAKPIYGWRMVPGSAAVAHDAKPYALDAARRALGEALQRRGTPGRIERGLVPGTWRPRYDVVGNPLVSILIPTRNGRRMLEHCIDSINEYTTYRNYELVVVDNGSDDPETLDYLQGLKGRVVRYPYRFNYARQMNMAVDEAHGDHVLFLNNDMEVITPGWLEAMVEVAQHSQVGAVGARLVLPSGRPQHEGVFIGFGGGSAGNADFGDYFGLGRMIRDATAVTAACMLMRLEAFHRVGGFDERLRVAFNDVDLCLRLRQRGYQIVYTPYAELYHAESASRGKLHPEEDEAFFVQRWGPPGAFRDPFYNPNLDPVRPFRLRR